MRATRVVVINMNPLHQAIAWYSACYRGDWSKIARAIQNHEDYQTLSMASSYITIVDDAYPACFRRLRYPPWILYYRGNLDLLNSKAVGIVGARNCSQQALMNTLNVVQTVKDHHVIVSGLAKGIDAMAHRGALDKKTIGIIGCGIDRIYPKVNADLYHCMANEHLILSEYPGSTAPLRHHFPWRNRLIAGCIDALIVIEATCRSGTMLTVNACNELGVPVYCLPTAFGNDAYPGCNHLIEQGANIVSNREELKKLFP